jgi:hypothetical protein
MAKIKFREMVIEIARTSIGNVMGNVVNAKDLPPNEVETMNKNLEILIDLYTPEPSSYTTSMTNSIASWIVNGLGDEAEIIEYDKVNHDPDLIY